MVRGRVGLQPTTAFPAVVTLNRVACLPRQMESDLGARTTSGVTLGLLADPQSQFDLILYDSRCK